MAFVYRLNLDDWLFLVVQSFSFMASVFKCLNNDASCQ